MKAWITSGGVVKQVVVAAPLTLLNLWFQVMANPRSGPLMNFPPLDSSFPRCDIQMMWSISSTRGCGW